MSGSSSSLFTSLSASRLLQNFSSPRFSFRGGSSDPSVQSSNSISRGANAFESELSAQLEELKSLNHHEAGYLTISWLCRAMGAILCTHASLEASLSENNSHGFSEADTKRLDDYLDDSVKLLDVCNALREAIDELKGYYVLVELAIHTLDKGSLAKAQLLRAKNALARCSESLKKRDEEVNQRRSKLENCSSILRRMGEKLTGDDSSKGNFFMVIYAAQVTTIFVCSLLTAALSLKPRSRLLATVPITCQPNAWTYSLNSLQQMVKEHVEKKKGKHAMLEELEKTDIAVRSLQELVQKFLLRAEAFPLDSESVMEMKKLLESVKECSTELYQGLGPLEFHIGEVFKVLIASRMALLNIYSHG